MEVRITRKEFPLEDIFKKCIFFREGNGVEVKHHLQGIVYDSIGLPALRARLRKQGLSGNQDYKCAMVKDEEKYLAYIAKDQHLVLNTTEIEIESYYGKYKKNKKRSKIEEIFENAETLDTKTLIGHALDYYQKNNLLLNCRLIAQYVQTWQFKMDPTSHSYEKFSKKIFDIICDNY